MMVDADMKIVAQELYGKRPKKGSLRGTSGLRPVGSLWEEEK